jgi:hypothetical protein
MYRVFQPTMLRAQLSKKVRWPKHYVKYALTMRQVFTLQDDAALASQDPLRSPMLMDRANELLFRYAKLGSVD